MLLDMSFPCFVIMLVLAVCLVVSVVANLDQKDTAGNLRSSLADRHREAEALRAELANVSGDLEEAESDLGESDASLDSMRAEMAEVVQELAATRAELTAERIKAAEEIQARDDALHTYREGMSDMQNRLRDLRHYHSSVAESIAVCAARAAHAMTL